MYSPENFQAKLEARNYKQLDLTGKKVLIRTCLNVPTDKDGNMLDRSRFDEALPLIKKLKEKASRVVVMAHLGRPKSNEAEFSFGRVHKDLEEALGEKVGFIDDLESFDKVPLNDHKVYLLENVRFFAGEDSKDKEERKQFATRLSSLGEVFINDAFADYKASASTYDIAKFLPSYVGPVFHKEVSALAKLGSPERPFVAILGGAKLSEKLDALLAVLKIADKVLVGGAMAYTLLASTGKSIGISLKEEDKIEVAKQIMTDYASKVVLPIDHLVVPEFKDPGKDAAEYIDAQDIPSGRMAVDIGQKTRDLFSEEIASAKTIMWNGPMGVYEWEATIGGTNQVGHAINENTNAYKLAGGGDSIAAINKLGLMGFSHISTGGGAMLAFMSYDEFPNLDVIING